MQIYMVRVTYEIMKEDSGSLPSLPHYPPPQSLTFKEEKISYNKIYPDFQEMQREGIYT